jgi:glc operon protein GlcG
MSLTLNEALACNDLGIARARQLGVQVSLVVVDEFGQLVQLDRMDGAGLMTPDVAEAKALTALNFKRPTSQVSKIEAGTLSAIADVVHFKVLPVAGGVPIYDGSDLKGAIGVSGASAQQDEEIATYAIGRKA